MLSYQYTIEDLSIVSIYDKKDHHFWAKKKSELASLRKSLREHYLPQQNYRCCYCKMKKQEKHGAVWDVEHIAPKSLYPLFMFEELNLCISCKECNGFKLEIDIFREAKTYKTYPKKSISYNIIHPHFDKYTDHMEVKMSPTGHLSHRAKTVKGRETMICCNLFRFSFEANNYDVDRDLLIKFSQLIDNTANLTPDSVKAYFQSVLMTTIPDDELNC